MTSLYVRCSDPLLLASPIIAIYERHFGCSL
jgi:hypothetical protein